MVKVGAALMLVGIAVLGGYSLYLVLRALFSAWASVPVFLQIGIPIALIGLALLMVAVVRDRLREDREDRFDGVKH